MASIAIACGLGPRGPKVSSSTDQLWISREDFHDVIQGIQKEVFRRAKQTKVHFCDVVDTFDLVYHSSLGI